MTNFLDNRRPTLCAMVQEKTVEGAACVIMDSLYDGADAFGIQLENLNPELRTPENLKKIFSYCEGRPVYLTSYRGGQSKSLSDEECMEFLLMGLDAAQAAGCSVLCDVMGDLYDKSPDQLTFDAEAVKKQIALIERIHEKGGEVLISSHLSRFFNTQEVMEYAVAQRERGADIIKIVNKSDSEDTMMENFETIHKLKKELGKPFLFLSAGVGGHKIRQIGPAFGVCMYLCTTRYFPVTTKIQPKLRAAKAIRDNMFL